LCHFAAGGEAEEDIVIKENPFDMIVLTAGVDTMLGKLIKVLNAFGGKIGGSARRLANAIRTVIVSTKPSRWDALIESMSIARGINVILLLQSPE
jgi:hypothetical protein